MSNDIKRIQQKAFRHSIQDGIIGIYGGLFLAFYAGFYDYVISDFQTNFPAAPFALFFAFSAFIIEFIRRRYTYPRIGYVKMAFGKETVFIIAVFVPLIIFPVILAIAVSFFSNTWNIDPLLKWSPIFFGVVLAILFYGLVVKSGNTRYYALSAGSVVSGLVLSFIPFTSAKMGIIIYLLIMGGLLFLWGLVAFIRFLRQYQKMPEENFSGNQ